MNKEQRKENDAISYIREDCTRDRSTSEKVDHTPIGSASSRPSLASTRSYSARSVHTSSIRPNLASARSYSARSVHDPPTRPTLASARSYSTRSVHAASIRPTMASARSYSCRTIRDYPVRPSMISARSYSCRTLRDSRPSMAFAKSFSARSIYDAPIQVLTPTSIKYEPKIKKEKVEATNDLHASVKDLSQWLADDPTRTSEIALEWQMLTPIHFRTKPRIDRNEIEATNKKIAPVKKITEWLDYEPFELHKPQQLRTGHNIIAKASMFEYEKELPKSRKVDVAEGKVSALKDFWTKYASDTDEISKGRIKGDYPRAHLPVVHFCPRPVIVDEMESEPFLHQYRASSLRTIPEQDICTDDGKASARDQWLGTVFHKRSNSICVPSLQTIPEQEAVF